ncbi:MAG: malonate-semialdehyde dehydrogenase (acetylating)/methylmalonate-semialdehyde dehydrogenase, partial [Arcobacteraceae bacterium]
MIRNLYINRKLLYSVISEKKLLRENMKYETIGNYINGEFCSTSNETLLVENPQTGETIAKVALATTEDVNFAVSKAKIAQVAWGKLNFRERSKYFYNYLNLLKEYREELAQCVKDENGKDLIDANAEVDKAIELCEFVCSIPQLPLTSIAEVSTGIVCKEDKRALGVVASITPFNFPIMVPHWTILNA